MKIKNYGMSFEPVVLFELFHKFHSEGYLRPKGTKYKTEEGRQGPKELDGHNFWERLLQMISGIVFML